MKKSIIKTKTLCRSLLIIFFILLGFQFLLTGVQAQGSDPVVAGAGDISPRNNGPQFQTAAVLRSINPTAVLTFGDNQYPDGILADFNAYYDKSWGVGTPPQINLKAITRPSPGNHDYHVTGAAGYFDYFNGVGVNNGPAGERGKGYYSFNVGSWHFISLNSEVMSATQNAWLQSDLQANQNADCTIAYWHNPRFSSSSTHGSSTRTAPFWDLLYQYKADIVLNGHDHTYERFAPQSPSAASEPTRGIREFVVGTGGAGNYPFGSPIANSQVRISTHGVIKLTLHANSYDWQFINTSSTILDSGSGDCVTASGTPTATPGPTSTPVVTDTPGPTSTPIGGNGDACGNGGVNAMDIKCVLNKWLLSLTNFVDQFSDGKINSLDFSVVAKNIGIPNSSPTPSSPPGQYLDNAMCNPDLGPAAFTTNITNQYLPFSTGYTNDRYLTDASSGFQVRMRILSGTKSIPGADGLYPIQTRILEEFETQNGNWVETSYNWFAQTVGGARPGTVCYFGEDVCTPGSPPPNCGAGGSWEAGNPVQARAGIMMPAGPLAVGMNWLIEDAACCGAYENGRVEQTGITFTVPTTPSTTFNNVIYIVEDNGNSNKRYAPGVGMISDEGALLTGY